MNCLAELCLISAVYLNGGIGLQADTDFWGLEVWQRSNKYGSQIGELSLVIDFKNNVYIEAKHISGLNYAEMDSGLNAVMIGVTIDLFKGE